MKKKILSLFLIFILLFSVPVSAYEITGYELHSHAAMLISLDTGDVLYAKNENERVYPASITTLMTAIVMIENIDDLDNTYLTYSNEMNNLILGTGVVVYHLKVGEQIKARDALASLLLASHGDVTYAIAEHIGGSLEGFVELMNAKAEELGLSNTHYVNPIGLHDDNHYTSATDIYKLAKYAFEIEIIKELTSKATYRIESDGNKSAKVITNSNMMLNPNSNVYYKPTVCGKTGFTDEAGRCLVSIASNSGYNYMAIVLNSKTVNGTRNEFVDSANMYRWAFRNFEYKNILSTSTPVSEMPVNVSNDTDFVQLALQNGLEALLPIKADSSTITIEPHLLYESVDAPVSKGDILGTADIYYAEEKIGTVNLVAVNDISVSYFRKIIRDTGVTIKKVFTSPIMIAVYILIGIGAIVLIVFTVNLNLNKKKRRKVKYRPLKKDELENDN